MGDGRSDNSAEFHRENSTNSDSIGLTTSIAMDIYKQRLPRRRKKASDGCWGLTCHSWLFLLLAFLQATLVTGIQIAIVVLGRFDQLRFEEQAECFNTSVNYRLQEAGFDNSTFNIETLTNFTYPSFGQDKQIYVYFFIAVVVYNLCLCFYALKFQNIVEVYTFMVINLLAMGYAGLQVFQFRGFGPSCPSVTIVGYLALANVLLLLIFNVIFGFLSLFIYVEFGWKTYVLVDCNPGMRYYYRVHQVFMSVVKLLILFLVIFCVIQDVLLLETSDFEFYLTIILGLVAIVAFPFVYLIVTFEFLPGAILLLLVALLLVAYYIFKIIRYLRRNCPVCEIRVNEVESELDDIQNRLQIDREVVRSLFDRAQEFINLTLFGFVSLLITIVTIVIFIHYWRQFGNGLKEYFGKYRLHRWIDKHFCCISRKIHRAFGTTTSSSDIDREPNDGVRSLRLMNEETPKRARNKNTSDSVLSKSRDSTSLDQSSYSPVTPNFDPAAANSLQRTTIN